VNLLDVRGAVDRLWQVQAGSMEGFLEGQEVLVSVAGDSVRLVAEAGASSLVHPASRADLAVAREVADAGRRSVTTVLTVSDQPVLRSLTFVSRLELTAPLDIGVDASMMPLLPSWMNRGGIAEACRQLRETLVIDREPPSVVVSAGTGELTEGTSVGAITLFGGGLSVDVRVIDDRWAVVRASTARREPRVAHLLEGPWQFVDASYAAAVDAVAAAEMARLSDSASSYLSLWRRYGELEFERAARRAERIPRATYQEARANLDGTYTLYLEGGGATALLEHLASTPTVMTVPLEATSRGSGSAQAVDGEVTLDPQHGAGAVTFAPLREAGPPPPQSGRLEGSATGDRVRHRRREQVLEAAQRHLPRRAVEQLLEGVAPPTVAPVRPVEPMSAAVREAFGGEPTPAQRRALDVALNTPDVALIQGPPGTGKTRVIAALQARLAELGSQDEASRRRVLLTAEQHDAVRNAISASVDTRLPPIKLGGRHGEADDEHLEAWSTSLRARLTARYPDEARGHLLELWFALQDRLAAIEHGGHVGHEVLDVLRWLRADAGQLLDPALRARVDRELLRREKTHIAIFPPSSVVDLERRIRALRTDVVAFADDGPSTCQAARSALSEFDVDPSDLELLDQLGRAEDPARTQLRRLQDLQERLIDRCVASRRLLERRDDDEATSALLRRCREGAAETIEARLNPVERVLGEFARRLRDEPVAVRNAILTHTSSLAATCQQTLSRDLDEVQLSEAPFDTVIIDEAARANPLDLLIPLSVAGRRVVFVGDHRQLPQMLEDELEERLAEERPDAAVEEVLRRSFFERLFTSLRSLEGGVERTVTLDQQFRMHPMLGDFLDEQFYRPHGESISNGLGTEERDLRNLPLGSPAVWVDVPRAEGGEKRDHSANRSWRRTSEARATASLVRSLIDADPTRSVGVITFYTGQEAAIWAQLEETGHATRGLEGAAISTTWRAAFEETGVPRVRIGTVDRFQGREFDVVLLSLVRCSPPPRGGAPGRASRRFGFLAHPNRLCVAMSRQRDALIVVGDRTSYMDDHAQELVPALAAFADLATVHEVADG
jgi:hypothetical protein